LVVLGSNHVMKSGDRTGDDNVTTAIESRYPRSTYVALSVYSGALDPATQSLLHFVSENPPELFELAGTTLGKAPDRSGVPVIKNADALLYLGPPEGLTLALPAAGSLEPEYLKEIDRRSVIEWGELRARKFLGPAAR
jgi:hypothetical protein